MQICLKNAAKLKCSENLMPRKFHAVKYFYSLGTNRYKPKNAAICLITNVLPIATQGK